MDLTRPVAPDPYSLLPTRPTFTLTSSDLVDGQAMPVIHTDDGDNLSPQLSWARFPRQTQSFVLECFDPDAPTPAGYWHWAVLDIDSETTSLEQGAGRSDLFLPGAASHIRNDASEFNYTGAAPPPGDHVHRYIFTVHALDVPSLNLPPEEITATALSFNTLFHTIARAHLTVTYQR